MRPSGTWIESKKGEKEWVTNWVLTELVDKGLLICLKDHKWPIGTWKLKRTFLEKIKFWIGW